MDNMELLNKLVLTIRDTYCSVIDSEMVTSYEKSKYDIVTSVDFAVEKELMNRISELDTGAVFLSEEYHPDTDVAGRVWIIDPIDGTCNFSNDINIYGVQCALYDEGSPLLAVIYLPFRNEFFTALRGEGAWLNGLKLRREIRPVEKSIISMGDFIHSSEEAMELEHRAMKQIAPVVERIRMVGAASVDFAFCAAGRFDGNITFTANPWDVMPGLLICREAGLIVTDLFGNPYTGQNETVAVFSSEDLMNKCILTM